jgi:hypothetical protein
MEKSRLISGRSVNFIMIAAAFLLVTAPDPVLAFRCGTRLVSPGDTSAEVRAKCGEPSHTDSWEEERIQREFVIPYVPKSGRSGGYSPYREPFLVKTRVKIEEWTYNLGPSSFTRYLRFENGRLVEIFTGSFGY